MNNLNDNTNKRIIQDNIERKPDANANRTMGLILFFAIVVAVAAFVYHMNNRVVARPAVVEQVPASSIQSPVNSNTADIIKPSVTTNSAR